MPRCRLHSVESVYCRAKNLHSLRVRDRVVVRQFSPCRVSISPSGHGDPISPTPNLHLASMLRATLLAALLSVTSALQVGVPASAVSRCAVACHELPPPPVSVCTEKPPLSGACAQHARSQSRCLPRPPRTPHGHSLARAYSLARSLLRAIRCKPHLTLNRADRR